MIRGRAAALARGIGLGVSIASIGGCVRGPATEPPSSSPPIEDAVQPPRTEAEAETPASAPPTASGEIAPETDRAPASPGEAPPAPAGPRRYLVLPEVSLSPEVESKLARIAEAYFRRTGKPLVLTSGTRDAERQAQAMYEVLRLGGDIVRLYRNKVAARELKRTYDLARLQSRSPGETVEALAAALRAQMERGVYVSAHLRAGAVDVRSYDMSPADRRAFVDGAREVGGAEVIEESAPPHFHLQLEDTGEADARRAGDPE